MGALPANSMDTAVGEMNDAPTSKASNEEGVGVGELASSEVGNGINALLALSEQVSNRPLRSSQKVE